MTSFERDALGAICLLAAFADGEPAPAELDRLKAIAAGGGMGGGDGGMSSGTFQRVMLKQVDVSTEAQRLGTPELRSKAFELAVGVCGADGVTTDQERTFLMGLARELGIDEGTALKTVGQVDALASAPINLPAVGVTATRTVPPPLPGVAGVSPASPVDAEVDASIRNHAILCGALELLPHGLASAAIIPVQMKMVYSVGVRYGYTLDSGHIKDLLATMGVGVVSQVVESFAQRIVGGLVGSVAGSVLGGALGRGVGSLTRAGTGAAFAFASTYALGRVAKQYYAGGRTLSAIDLRALYQQNVSSAKGVYEQYRPMVEQQAGSLSPSRLAGLLQGR